MTELLSSCGNYGAYRRAYADCSGFKIPIVGVHLKDLVSLHEALPDRLDGGRLNLSKLQSLYEPAWELRMLQQTEPPFQANKDLVHLLTVRHVPWLAWKISRQNSQRNMRVPSGPDWRCLCRICAFVVS